MGFQFPEYPPSQYIVVNRRWDLDSEVTHPRVGIMDGEEWTAFHHFIDLAHKYAANIHIVTPEAFPAILFHVALNGAVNAFAEPILAGQDIVAFRSSITSGLVANIIVLCVGLLSDPANVPEV